MRILEVYHGTTSCGTRARDLLRLAREDPEWAYAWSYFPDPVLVHPASGECLEYMGSAQYPGRGWVHVFRHRQIPGSDLRQYWQVPASVGWQPVPPRQG